jgi:hypothetical protein
MNADSKNLVALALSLAPKVHIEGLRLTDSTIKSNLTKEDVSLRVEYSLGAKTQANRETNKITVQTLLAVAAKSASDEDTNCVRLSIKAKFLLDYSVKSLEGITDEILDAFGKVNGIHNIWPYWREYVQTTTCRLSLPPLVLPVLTGNVIAEFFERQENSIDLEAG